LVVATAAVYSALVPPKHEASSLVLLSRQSVASQLSGGADVGLQQQSFQQVLTTQARLARTPTVLQGALRGAGPSANGLSQADLAANSTATADPSSDLLDFAVRADRPQTAVSLAAAYAASYVAYRRRLDSVALQSALRDVNRAVAEARERGDSADSLVERLSVSKQQLETRIALLTANAQVVSVPQKAEQIQPNVKKSIVLGLLVGVAVGLAAAFVRDSLDTRIRTSDAALATFDSPILSRIRSPRRSAREAERLVMLEDAGGPDAEAFRILRTNLSFGIAAHGARVVTVTSSVPGEGKSTTIANLAIAFAAAGKRVVLVDLDLRKPKVATFFDASASLGVTGVAIGEETLGDALVRVDAVSDGVSSGGGSLEVLPSGAIPPNPSEFLGAASVKNMIGELSSRADLVLLDAPPILAVSDASVVLAYADALFVCVRLGVARRPMLRDAREAVRRTGVPLLGQVVTGARSDEATASYYGYGPGGAAAETARLRLEA
jgi:capsular exopolysaccharide synthesis family protein